MNEFKSFGIKPPEQTFIGDKIEIYKILNKKITVNHFSIDISKFTEKGNGMRLTMQIEVDGVKRVIFTGSTTLQEMIKKVPTENFPFTTIITKENDRFEFT